MSDEGFVVKDKRRLRENGEVVEPDSPAEESIPKDTSSTEKKDGAAREKGSTCGGTPLPEINFSTFVFSLSTSALVSLGEIPEPNSGEKCKNLPLAKQSIDILGMLQEKTKGNLDREEENLLINLLYELRLKFVAAAKE